MHEIHDPTAIRLALCSIALAQIPSAFTDASFDDYRLARVQRDVRGAFSLGDLTIARRAPEGPVAWSRVRASDVVLAPADLAWLEVA